MSQLPSERHINFKGQLPENYKTVLDFFKDKGMPIRTRVYKFIRAGRVKYTKVNGTTLYCTNDLQNALDRKNERVSPIPVQLLRKSEKATKQLKLTEEAHAALTALKHQEDCATLSETIMLCAKAFLDT